ncbi:MAG TPA: MiaB/RimO family radical SAM methylthiotransferase [Methylomirabilota bacterium]|jgi:tRNA-2-methylthio-N6-dimethylallyladenosine synthase|nr:MiaB/RimO family radical SAM methylthiotransferase [Methylomirabilota bacterium]
MAQTVFLQTYGCQMNERDSEEILGMLTAQGYAMVDREEDADVILLNTCSVRAHAEERAIGKMGLMQKLKRERPHLVLGILGCMAKTQREDVFRRLPQVDLVAGPAEIYDLPDLLAGVAERRQRSGLGAGARVLAVDRTVRPLDRRPAIDYRARSVAAFVTIMEGCDKKCAYCIVPTTRGQEVSRPVDEILDEVQHLARAGYRQATLLGQNVNSYGKRFPDGSGWLGPGRRRALLQREAWREAPVGERPGPGAPETSRLVDFPVLLRAIDRKTSIARVRFTTSHPFDAHEELFRAMADCRTVCEFLHLPVQSGSDRVLTAMRRGYTVDAYLAKITRLRELVPDVALSTDIIAGFPGETEADFEATCDLMERVGYDSAFVFKYSPRPGTEAAGWPDDVPQPVKERRNRILLDLQARISREKLRTWIGRDVEVLVEERNRRGQLSGKSRSNTTVVAEGPDSLIGELVRVRVTRVTETTMIGELGEPATLAR